jgi:hypothetical protein
MPAKPNRGRRGGEDKKWLYFLPSTRSLPELDNYIAYMPAAAPTFKGGLVIDPEVLKPSPPEAVVLRAEWGHQSFLSKYLTTLDDYIEKCYSAGVERVILHTATTAPYRTLVKAILLPIGLILPYFHHAKYWSKPLSERKLVVHYSVVHPTTPYSATAKGTEEVLKLNSLISGLGYKLIIYSWHKPEGIDIPDGVEWLVNISLADVFRICGEARLFVTATNYDSWSRAFFYALMLGCAVAAKDNGAEWGAMIRELAFPVATPEQLGLFQDFESWAGAVETLLKSDEAYFRQRIAWDAVRATNPLYFNEYEIARHFDKMGLRLPCDFIPSCQMPWVGRDCFPSDLTCSDSPTIVVKE